MSLAHALQTRALLALLALAPLLGLGGCGGAAAQSDAAVARTAGALGCWHADGRPTPPPVTVTLAASPARTAPAIVNPGAPTRTPAPTATPRATTTPLPRCTPAPGETQEPWPTRIGTPAAFPTRPIAALDAPVDGVALRLPDFVDGLDLAVHPTQGWPLVAAVNVPIGSQGAPRVFVRAWRPGAGAWGAAQSVDTPGSHPGTRLRSVAAAISYDGTLHAVWGASEFPALALFAATSTDGGESWGPPAEVGRGYQEVLDAAPARDGSLYVLALRRASDTRTDAVLLRRAPDGAWGAAEPLPGAGPVWYGSSGSLAIVGGHGAPAIVAALTADESRPGDLSVLRRPLAGTPPRWTSVRLTTPDAAGALAHLQLRPFPYQVGVAVAEGLAISAVRREGGALYAAASLDGGASWGGVQVVARAQGGQGRLPAGSVAYDPAARRLIALWECCADATEGSVESTHYGAWADPAGGAWSPPPAAPAVPLISGARSAALTVMAQAPNLRSAWLAWLEGGHVIRVRSFPPDQIIPPGQYPPSTPRPSATSTP